jgi:serine protease Do
MACRWVRCFVLGVAAFAVAQAMTPPSAAVAQGRDPVAIYGGLEPDVRVALQRALVWVDAFNGIADGNIGPRTIGAIEAFQRSLGHTPTGLLSRPQVDELFARARRIEQAIGYRVLRDDATGAAIGVPSTFLDRVERVRRGTRLTSASGNVDMVTMAISTSERSLRQHYEMTLRNRPRPEYAVFRDGWFVIAGNDREGRRYYVRMHDIGHELRGFAISYDRELERALNRTLAVMSSDFRPVATGASVAEVNAGGAGSRDRIAALAPSPSPVAPPPSQGARSPSPAGTGGPHQPIRGTTSSGTGFVVSGQGHFLTNAHVVEGCSAIGIGGLGNARLIDADRGNDLALLQVDATVRAAPLPFTRRGPRLGDEVIALGFPLANILRNGLNMTRGDISSLAGIGGDSRFVQTTAAVQPGNSGGPLIDRQGNVVGIVTARLSDRATDATPQNVNFAINAGLAESFLRRHGLEAAAARSGPNMDPPTIVQAAQDSVMPVVCVR